jgi:hypothetical protein
MFNVILMSAELMYISDDDHDIEYSDDLIVNKIMPSFEPAPSLS